MHTSRPTGNVERIVVSVRHSVQWPTPFEMRASEIESSARLPICLVCFVSSACLCLTAAFEQFSCVLV